MRAALPLLLRAVAGLENIHGAEHPCSLFVVAMIYSVNNYGGAREYIETALKRMKRVLGEDHPVTKDTAVNLAGLLFKRGRHQEAHLILQSMVLEPAGVRLMENVGSNRSSKWYYGWYLFAIGFILLGICFLPGCMIVAGIILGGSYLPKPVIVGGMLLGFYFYQRVLG